MGFRDIFLLNIALIGKQGWRLLQNIESLVYGVLKARYFSHTFFLNSQLRRNPSFIWHSIWEAKSSVAAGYRWKIGNGQQVRVWQDKWLHFTANLKPQTPKDN